MNYYHTQNIDIYVAVPIIISFTSSKVVNDEKIFEFITPHNNAFYFSQLYYTRRKKGRPP